MNRLNPSVPKGTPDVVRPRAGGSCRCLVRWEQLCHSAIKAADGNRSASKPDKRRPANPFQRQAQADACAMKQGGGGGEAQSIGNPRRRGWNFHAVRITVGNGEYTDDDGTYAE